MTERYGALALSTLIIVSSILVGVGPSLTAAQTAEPVGYQYTDSPDILVVDTSEMNSSFTAEFTTQGGPGSGTTILARDTYDTANLDGDELLFYADGAYESLNVTISSHSGTPKFDTYSALSTDALFLDRTVVGSTGGDSDLTCDTTEQIAQAVRPIDQLDCTPQPGSTTVNTTGTDAEQTKIDIYQSAQNQKASSENFNTTLNNYLTDTATQARIVGKSAYIRSLNNGSSEAAATTAAKEAVADYYKTKQKNLLTRWNLQVQNAEYLHNVIANESGISTSFVGNSKTQTYDGFNPTLYQRSEFQGFGSKSVTYVDGTTGTAQTYNVRLYETNYDTDQDARSIGPADGGYSWSASSNSNDISIRKILVQAPNSNYDTLTYVHFDRFKSVWEKIPQQNTVVQNDMDTLVNNTYSEYQSGEINNTDLIDPYVLASERSPSNQFQGWAAAQLTLLGTNSPDNFDQIGSFEIVTETNDSYGGVLFSADNPASGEFAANNTYDPSAIGGTQYVVTSDRIVELTENFTVQNITTTNGERIQNVTIEKKTYQTTNVTELKELYEQLAQDRAEWEAREQALLDAAGGGGLFGNGSVSPIVALAVIGTLLAVAVLQD